MMWLEQPPLNALREPPSIVKMAAGVAAAQRASYGRRWDSLRFGADELQVDFQESQARRVEMQCRLRCAGLDFELQVVEPSALIDLGAALSPGVPLPLQRAAVLHAAEALLLALEQRFGARIELTGLSGTAPAWDRHQAIGLQVNRLMLASSTAPGPDASSPSAPSDERPRSSAVLLRALQTEGWQLIQGAASRMAASPAAHDTVVTVSAHAESIPLRIGELRQLEAGDVLLMKASADGLRRTAVTLKLGPAPLPGLRAVRTGSQLRITAVPATSASTLHTVTVADVEPTAPTDAHPSPRWSASMNSSDPANTVQDLAQVPAAPTDLALDAVQVDIELELGRIRLRLSELRHLAVGQVYETDRSADGEGVVLWCGGQRLGLGQLVTVGERLGVRVTALTPAGSEAAPSAARHRP